MCLQEHAFLELVEEPLVKFRALQPFDPGYLELEVALVSEQDPAGVEILVVPEVALGHELGRRRADVGEEEVDCKTQLKRRLIAFGVEMGPKESKLCCSIFATQV